MPDKVKVLVVGLGNMGASHASAYHRNPGFEIVGLMSRSIKSKKIPDELKGYPLFEDYDEALKVAKPDAVSINSWPNTHAEYAIKAINGKAARPEELSDARTLLKSLPAGSTVEFSIRRGGEDRVVRVTLRDLI